MCFHWDCGLGVIRQGLNLFQTPKHQLATDLLALAGMASFFSVSFFFFSISSFSIFHRVLLWLCRESSRSCLSRSKGSSPFSRRSTSSSCRRANCSARSQSFKLCSRQHLFGYCCGPPLTPLKPCSCFLHCSSCFGLLAAHSCCMWVCHLYVFSLWCNACECGSMSGLGFRGLGLINPKLDRALYCMNNICCSLCSVGSCHANVSVQVHSLVLAMCMQCCSLLFCATLQALFCICS